MTPAEQVVQVDVVIVGSGAGGGTMARALAGQDASVLLLERGDWLATGARRTPTRRSSGARSATAPSELWLNGATASSRPFMHYLVGGNTNSGARRCYRLREADFGEVEHPDGLSPAWPIDYADARALV